MDMIPAFFGRPMAASWGEKLLDITSIHATVTGVLAGFNIALVVLLATAKESQQGSDEQRLLKQATIGIFMVAFVGYISTAILYSAVPQWDPGLPAYFLYAAATSMYHFSSVLAFLGLSPLFEIVDLPLLRRVARITLFGAVFGGFFAGATPYHDLLRISTGWIVLSLVASIVLSAIILSVIRRRDLLRNLPRVLYASIGLIILIFTLSILLFFAPGIDLWERCLPKIALVLLITATSFALSVPSVVLFALRNARVAGLRRAPSSLSPGKSR